MTAPTYDALIRALGPVAWWRLADAPATTTTAVDSSGYGHTGTAHGGVTFTQTPGPIPGIPSDTAALFNSSRTNYIAAVGNVPAGPAGTFTLGAWVNRGGTAWPASHRMVISSTTVSSVFLDTLVGNMYVSMRTTGTTKTLTGPAIPITGWHFILFTYDGAMMRTYLDGVAGATRAVANGPQSGWTVPFNIGCYNAPSNYFTGQIAQAFILDYALTPTQITGLYGARTVPAATPIVSPTPPGRGRWRVTLHRRAFSPVGWQTTLIAELTNARGRRLEQQLNQPSQFVFTMNGRDAAALLVNELQTDVIAWRWDTVAGVDVPYFRGVVGQSEDQLTEQEHIVNFTCHDYGAMLTRRYLTRTLAFTNTDQDSILASLVTAATTVAPSGGSPPNFSPGSFLPLSVHLVNGDGTARGQSGVLRIRNYAGQSSVGQLIHDLALVIGGYDYDVTPAARFTGGGSNDALRVFYPSQGITRTEPLEYGGAIATVTRAVDSSDYGNYWRVIGNNGSSTPATPQIYGEASNADANTDGRIPVGLWQSIDSGSDVNQVATLVQQAGGDLDLYGVLVPHYTLGLRPGAYGEGNLNMGDTVPVIIQSGRLAVNTSVRIVGLTFDIGDDGQEDVSIVVGRPLTSLLDMMTATAADVNALARR